MEGIRRGILLVVHNNVMDMNDVMLDVETFYKLYIWILICTMGERQTNSSFTVALWVRVLLSLSGGRGAFRNSSQRT